MNRHFLIGAIWAGTLVALFIPPAAADAKHGEEVIGASQSVELRLKGSKGYAISVSGNRETVTLTAKRGGSSATYTSEGFASPTRMKARLGRLGRVSVRFHPHGRPKRIPASHYGCRGGAETIRSGAWVGRVEFDGEQMYTAVHATRAKGTVTRSPKLVCSNNEGKEGNKGGSSDAQWTILSASDGVRPIFLSAFVVRSKTHPKLNFSGLGASLVEVRSRKLGIFRSINAVVKNDAAVLNEDGGQITSATVAPPAPFEGTAAFQKTQGSKGSWTGTLTGDFPGRGEVALAGPKFSAEVMKISSPTDLLSLIRLQRQLGWPHD